MGVKAVECLLKGEHSLMIGHVNGVIITRSILEGITASVQKTDDSLDILRILLTKS